MKIFLSYRRDDTAPQAGRVCDRLRDRFGEERVFMDVVGIAPGLDFVKALEEALDATDVMVAVIGRSWLGAGDEPGECRLEDPDDYVRLEITRALERNRRVIPVLVDGAQMPAEVQMPAALAPLATLNAIDIRSGASFETDMGRLLESLGEAGHHWILGGIPAGGSALWSRGHPRLIELSLALQILSLWTVLALVLWEERLKEPHLFEAGVVLVNSLYTFFATSIALGALSWFRRFRTGVVQGWLVPTIAVLGLLLASRSIEGLLPETGGSTEASLVIGLIALIVIAVTGSGWRTWRSWVSFDLRSPGARQSAHSNSGTKDSGSRRQGKPA